MPVWSLKTRLKTAFELKPTSNAMARIFFVGILEKGRLEVSTHLV